MQKNGEKYEFLRLKAETGSPVKSFRMVAQKGSVASLKEITQLGCVSHDSPQTKSVLH